MIRFDPFRLVERPPPLLGAVRANRAGCPFPAGPNPFRSIASFDARTLRDRGAREARGREKEGKGNRVGRERLDYALDDWASAVETAANRAAAVANGRIVGQSVSLGGSAGITVEEARERVEERGGKKGAKLRAQRRLAACVSSNFFGLLLPASHSSGASSSSQPVLCNGISSILLYIRRSCSHSLRSALYALHAEVQQHVRPRQLLLNSAFRDGDL